MSRDLHAATPARKGGVSLFGVLGLVMWALPVSSGLAQPPRDSSRPEARLIFEGGEDTCFNETGFQEQVRTRLGYDPFSADAERSIALHVDVSARELSVRVELSSPQSDQAAVREIDGSPSECDALLSASVLAVSIAIDPAVLSRPPGEPPPRPEPEPVFEPELEPVVEPAPLVEPEPVPVENEGLALSGSAYLGGHLSIGATPGVSGGGSLGVELRYRALRLAIGLRGDVPRSTDFQGGTVSAHTFGGEISACGHWSALFACAAGVIGATRAVGGGFETNEVAYLVYTALGLRLGAEFTLNGPVALRAQLDFLTQPTPAKLTVGTEEAWSMAPFSMNVGLGVVVHLE